MTRHCYRRRAALTCAAGAAVLLALTACGSRPAPGTTVHIGAEADTTTPAVITINPANGETFTPTSSGNPALTASQAWADFAQLNNWGSTEIPAGTTAQLGLLTLPAGSADAPGAGNLTQSGGEAYTALNQLAWGFSSKQCGPVLPPAPVPGSSTSPAPAPTPSNCVEWLFLDANTGAQIDLTWQQ
jgi:hypothetical protein